MSDPEIQEHVDYEAIAAIEHDLAARGAYDDAADLTGYAAYWDSLDEAGREREREMMALHVAEQEARRDPDAEIVDAEIVGDSTEVEPVGFDDALIPLEGVAALRRGLLTLDDQRQELARVGNVDDLAYGVADLGVVMDDLSNLRRAARDDIAKILLARQQEARDRGEKVRGNPKHEVPGLGVIDVPGGNEWKDWDSPRLLRKLMRDAILDEDGDLLHFDHPAEVVERVYEVISACLPITASLGWRVGQFDKTTEEWTGLRGAGIDPEDYATHAAKPRLAKVPNRPES